MNFRRLWRNFIQYINNNQIAAVSLLVLGLSLLYIYRNEIYSFFYPTTEAFTMEEEEESVESDLLPRLKNFLTLVDKRLHLETVEVLGAKSALQKIQNAESISAPEREAINTFVALYLDLERSFHAIENEPVAVLTEKAQQYDGLLTTIEKTRTLLDKDRELYESLLAGSKDTGVGIMYDDEGQFSGVVSAPPVKIDETALKQQLIKKLSKLQVVNEENIKYYKKLNTDQQELLLEIIEGRNEEIRELEKQLQKLSEKKTLAEEKEIAEEKKMLAEEQEIEKKEAECYKTYPNLCRRDCKIDREKYSPITSKPYENKVPYAILENKPGSPSPFNFNALDYSTI